MRWKLLVAGAFLGSITPAAAVPGWKDGTSLSDAESVDMHKHTALIGLRYDFAPESPPLLSLPPAPPPAPIIPKQYIVFFGFNEANLTVDAQRLVGEAAKAARNLGAATILAVGHTDTAGSARFNKKLSERRANSVKAELVRLGLSQTTIKVSDSGEAELLIVTGDGGKEHRIRRAAIDLR